MKVLIALAVAALVACPVAAQVPTGTMGELRPDQKQFFELYKELVETDTTVANGSCTQAAGQIAARLKAAGFADDQITLFSVPEHPKEGGIVAIYPGTSATLPRTALGAGATRVSSPSRYFPVRTRTPRIPSATLALTSNSASSPTITISFLDASTSRAMES